MEPIDETDESLSDSLPSAPATGVPGFDAGVPGFAPGVPGFAPGVPGFDAGVEGLEGEGIGIN